MKADIVESEFLGDENRLAVDRAYDFGYRIVAEGAHECGVAQCRSDCVDIGCLMPDDKRRVGAPVQSVDGVFEFFSFVV